MKRMKGWVLALLGFVILVGSLVLSTPFAGHGGGGGERAAAHRASPFAPLPGERAEGGALAAADHGGTPYQETGPIVFRGDEPEAQLSFPVPLGKRLVIETVSVRVQVGAGQRAGALFMTTLGAASSHYAVPLSPQGSLGKGESFAATLPVRAYAGPGTSVWFKVERTAPGESDGGFITLSGVLE
jgi:hypothetical protein